MKKGFTLVELLAVIVILGVLAVIVIPPVIKNIDLTRKASYNQVISNIEQTTQLYIRDNRDYIAGITTVGNVVYLTLQDLVDSGDLDAPITDPRSERQISLATQIIITVKAQSKYTVTLGTIEYVVE